MSEFECSRGHLMRSGDRTCQEWVEEMGEGEDGEMVKVRKRCGRYAYTMDGMTARQLYAEERRYAMREMGMDEDDVEARM